MTKGLKQDQRKCTDNSNRHPLLSMELLSPEPNNNSTWKALVRSEIVGFTSTRAIS